MLRKLRYLSALAVVSLALVACADDPKDVTDTPVTDGPDIADFDPPNACESHALWQHNGRMATCADGDETHYGMLVLIENNAECLVSIAPRVTNASASQFEITPNGISDFCWTRPEAEVIHCDFDIEPVVDPIDDPIEDPIDDPTVETPCSAILPIDGQWTMSETDFEGKKDKTMTVASAKDGNTCAVTTTGKGSTTDGSVIHGMVFPLKGTVDGNEWTLDWDPEDPNVLTQTIFDHPIAGTFTDTFVR